MDAAAETAFANGFACSHTENHGDEDNKKKCQQQKEIYQKQYSARSNAETCDCPIKIDEEAKALISGKWEN